MDFAFSKDDIRCIVHSIISEQLSRRDGGYFPLHPLFKGRGFLDKKPFSCDSLTLVSLATQIGDFFGVAQVGLEEYFLRHKDIQSWVDIVYDSLKHYSKTLTFLTSGTTGPPKRIEHKTADILKETQFLTSLFAGRKEIDAFVRVHHIYGFLYAIALPKILGIKVSYHEPLPSREFFKKKKDNLIVATPPLYAQLDLYDESFDPSSVLVSSTEPLSEKTYELLRQKGASRIYEFYGSSESLGIGYKDAHDSPFVLFDYLNKDELLMVQDDLKFLDDTHFFVRNRKDSLVKHRGYKLDLQAYEKEFNALKNIQEARVKISKGSLNCFVKAEDKDKAMEDIASLELKPDQIIWM